MAVMDFQKVGADRIKSLARQIEEHVAQGRVALNAKGLFDLPPALLRPALDHIKLGDRFKFERHQMAEAIKRDNERARDFQLANMMVEPRRIGTVIRPEMWQRNPPAPARYPGDDEMGGPRMLKQHIGPEATINRMVPRHMGRSDAKNVIEAQQGRYLSGGQATTAYRVRVFVKDKDRYDHLASPDHMAPEYASHFAAERCYRVSSKDEAARRVIDLAVEHQDDPYAPTVYAVYDLRDGSWASEMELLDKAFTPGIRADEDKMLYGWQLVEDWKYEGRRGKVVPSRLLLDKSPFMRAVDKLRVRIGAEYDLHGANVMKRGEQIVVLDPLYKC